MITASCPARAALAGNPSDGFGGAVFAVPLRSMRATVGASPAPEWDIDAGAEALLRATVTGLARHVGRPLAPARLRYHTTVPRTVGLAGSSAIVIAALRCLCELNDLPLPDGDELASLALAVETDVLGIAAGLQDRVVQVRDEPTLMNFAPAAMRTVGGLAAGTYESVDTTGRLELLVAARAAAAESSQVPHSALRARAAVGDPDLAAAARRLASHATHAATAWREADVARLATHVDGTFDLRRELIALEPAHVEMVDIARAAGCAANYTGSGGSIVVLAPQPDRLDRAEGDLVRLGCRTARLAFPPDRSDR